MLTKNNYQKRFKTSNPQAINLNKKTNKINLRYILKIAVLENYKIVHIINFIMQFIHHATHAILILPVVRHALSMGRHAIPVLVGTS